MESMKDKPAPDWTGHTWDERYRACVLVLRLAGVMTVRQRDGILKKIGALK